VTSRPHGNLELIRRVLGDNYLELGIQKMILEESFETGRSKVKLFTKDTQGHEVVLDGDGVGVVDAIWLGLLSRYATEYQSLKSLELANFTVQARLDTKKHRDGTDAVGEVSLEVRNSEGTLFSFSDASRSITKSASCAVVAAVEYFLNAERAFVTLYRSRQDARERQRDDLVTRYTQELAEVVKSTSYSTVVENITKELTSR
jgi:hypothetical protein